MAKCHELATEFSRQLMSDESSEEHLLKRRHLAEVALQMEAWAREVDFRLQSVFQRMGREKIKGSAHALSHLGATSLDLQQNVEKEPPEVGVSCLENLFLIVPKINFIYFTPTGRSTFKGSLRLARLDQNLSQLPSSGDGRQRRRRRQLPRPHLRRRRVVPCGRDSHAGKWQMLLKKAFAFICS